MSLKVKEIFGLLWIGILISTIPFLSMSEELTDENQFLLPNILLIDNVPDEFHIELAYLNRITSISDIRFCYGHAVSILHSPCLGVNLNVKYMVNFQSDISVGLRNGEISTDALSDVEQIFLSKVREYLLEQIRNQSEKFSVAQPLFGSMSHGDLGTDWCSSSPEIFTLSCRQHDFCYESGTAKGVCDDVFYENMFTEAHLYTQNSTEPTYQELATYLSLAALYFEAVVHSSAALSAFCDATSGDFDLCDELVFELVDQNDNEHSSGTNGGIPTGDSSSGQTGALDAIGLVWQLNYTCQLWKFPDGNGSFYYLWRECMYSINAP